MWLPDSKTNNYLWHMTDGEPFTDSSILNKEDKQIIEEWAKWFEYEYREWLAGESKDLYNPFYSLNGNMVKHLEKINARQSEFQIFYWFDVDRSEEPDYVWICCPVSGLPLANLGSIYTQSNRLISIRHPMCFPETIV